MPPNPHEIPGLGQGDSLCPECLRLIPCTREFRGQEVYQVKECPEARRIPHPHLAGPAGVCLWRRPKIPAQLAYTETPGAARLPF